MAVLRSDGRTIDGSYSLMTSFPRKHFNEEELKTLTLKDAGLFPRAVVIIEENK